MSGSWKPGDPVPHVHDGVAETVVAAGLSPRAVPALLDFDVANFQLYRVSTKGEMARAILRHLRLDLDVGHYYAITAVIRIQTGVGRPASEATIGLVAEELSVDPSRASRVVADLVARGYLRREVSQQDSRRAVLTVTDAGLEVVTAFRTVKWKIMAEVFCDWPPETIARFAKGVRAYTEGVQAVLARMAPPAEPRHEAAE